MTDYLKILGQAAPSGSVLTDIYTVPIGVSATVSTITVSNRAANQPLFRISVAVTGSIDDPKQYLYYDIPIDPNETFATTIGITMSAGDVLRGYSSTSDLSFNVFGVEVS